MLRNILLTGVATAFVASATPTLAQDQDLTAPDYPETRSGDVVDTQFGVDVADPYRWLENDVRQDDEVAAWVTAQNEVTDAFLARLPGREALKQRITQLTDYERFGLPTDKGGHYFYTRNDGLQNQSVLYVRDGLQGEARVLIDPNEWSEDDATALADYAITEDGSKLLYAIQDGGSDWRTVEVMDVATGEVMADKVEWVKFSNLDWAKDGSGFYYSRFPATGEGETFQALNTNQQVYFHKLGTDQDADRLVYETPEQPELNHVAQVSDDGRWLIVTSSSGTDERYEINLIDLERPDADPMTLVPGFEYDYSYVGNLGSRFFFVTNEGAPLKKVVTTDITAPQQDWATVIPESEQTLNGLSLVGGKLIANYLVDAKSKIEVFGLDGTREGDVELPGIGSAGGFGGDPDETETFYAFSSYNRPTTVYRYDVATGESTVWAQPEVAFDPEDFVVEQKFYTSKDGTQVPMFLVRSREVAESGAAAPTLLYGYGGFNISLTPGFSPSRIAWMEAGGAYAVANIRGGGEYGKAWHDGGRLDNKQNVFDDFIAAGEYLVAEGITPEDGLAIQGGSNGGLLVGAVANQRPDLFAAGNAAVGVMDMLRFNQFTAGRYWVDDYGYPDREDDFRTLLAYSPYHNVRDGEDYPALLVTTADTDDRVVPGHSFKYTAALQAADLGERPQLIRIETRAGHGSGKPTDKAIEEASDILAFLAAFTGLDLSE
ncbi:prolyl oligopeptidase family serine peptidase [Alteriqipengyuania lutimaris]|uniref:prolyl oligopeptidase n=1 Tax=Alteriqipengyuania lutimaris TaxID=1538146 RepID=A0A395LGH4_9SPHN|nr:prolyl oligopeptidase family serine peptidase [Alteriqipengyuania lutimaris]MBB3035293.1 prolyl oligopeptidase [Alteriqipengyuania lutimaris]RDS75882.1 S9 family peptidase [Alteriqipengyuania lutimaris]